jgi:TIR domain/Pentapeptide repeats (8 copies)
VWWDRNLVAGREFRTTIEQELVKARCVVVLWSTASIKKNWVIDEASEGQKREVLVPAFLESVLPPLGFRQTQAVDLSDWQGGLLDARFQALCRYIAAILDPGSRRPVPPTNRLHQLLSSVTVYDPAGSRRRLQEFRSLALAQTSDDILSEAVLALKRRLGFVAAEEGASAVVRQLRSEIFESIKSLAPAPLASYIGERELEGMDLYGFDFSGADLRNVSFRGAFLVKANLAEANLENADLTGAGCEMRILRGLT